MPNPFSNLFPPTPFPDLRFSQLQERLLRAGIAPRHVRRYLAELADHLADLTAEEQSRSLSPSAAHSAALARLGTTDTLANAMLSQPNLQSLTARAPWAVLGLAPVLLLAILWTLSLSLLWYGWQHFLPAAPSPFGAAYGPHRLFDPRNIYFQLDRALFFVAPMLIGWAAALIAARQRLSPAWPAIGLALLSTLVCTVQVITAHRCLVTGVSNTVRVHFLGDRSASSLVTATLRTVIVLCILMLPYVTERLRSHNTVPA